jgi:hypothetical protein
VKPLAPQPAAVPLAGIYGPLAGGLGELAVTDPDWKPTPAGEREAPEEASEDGEQELQPEQHGQEL